MYGRRGIAIAAGLAGALLWAGAIPALAHCDTKDGPVAKDAYRALAKGDVTPVLKWVKPSAEPEVRAAFRKALAVRRGGPDARELADTYFLETLVRVHRAGEGAPYTGLKPAGHVEPPIAAADAAIVSGSAEALARSVAERSAAGVRQRFARVRDARRHADDSVAAGRAYVAAYVDFIHYVERLHGAAASPGGEYPAAGGAEPSGEPAAHAVHAVHGHGD